MAILCTKTFTVASCTYDMLLDWEPAAYDLTNNLGYYLYQDDSSVTDLVFEQSTLITAAGTYGIQIKQAPTINTITFSALTIVYLMDISACTALTSINLSTFQSVGTGGLSIINNTLLTSVNLAAFFPALNTNNDFRGNALNQSTVDQALARAVANAAFAGAFSRLRLDGGTNSAPSATGALDVITLTGRGCTVTTN